MNDLIQSTLSDRATRTDAGAGGIDLDAVISQGRQRVRRRRVAGGAGALALVAVLGVAAPFVLGGAGDDGAQVARDPGSFAGEVSWGDGSQVRVGDRTVDLGFAPRAYVLSTSGIVATDAEGVVRFADGVGEPTEIGSTQQDYGTLLVADGGLVAWYDEAAGEYVAYDTAAGEVARTIPVTLDQPGEPGELEVPMVRALDGTTLWAFADKQIEAYDVGTGEMVFSAGADNFRQFDDAANGVVTESIGDPEGEAADQRIHVFDPALPGYVGTPVPGEGRAGLSPEATYVVTDPEDSEQVWEVAGGDDVTPALPDGFAFQAVVQWLSPDTYQALSFTEDSLVSGRDEDLEPAVLTCSVASGACEVDATDVAALDALALPNGVAQDL